MNVPSALPAHAFWAIDSLAAIASDAPARSRSPRSAATGSPRATGVSIDSRTIAAGQVFIAIKGDRFDGHDFVPQALAAGAGLVLVERPPPAGAADDARVVRVPSTRAALIRLAAAYRAALGQSGTRVIAVGGSNGKTTTTRLLHAALSAARRGTCSQKSFNNDLGVPLTVLAAKPGDDFLIAEIGTNHPGEIAPLAAILHADVAIITSIGREHLEGFGDVAGVAREEAALLPRCAPDATLILPAPPDAPDLWPHVNADVTAGRRIRLFSARAEGHARPGPFALTRLDLFRPDPHADAAEFTLIDDSPADSANSTGQPAPDRPITFRLPMLGRHNAANALAAILAARSLGLDDAAIARGLAAAKPAELRLHRRRIGTLDVLVDAYNANPDSTLAALSTFADLFGPATAFAGRRVVILGDMLELGAASDAAHAEIGHAALRAAHADLLIALGAATAHAADAFVQAAFSLGPRGAAFSADPAGPRLSGRDRQRKAVFLGAASDAALAQAASLLQPGDAVLLKGSRGNRLERLLPMLEAISPASPPA